MTTYEHEAPLRMLQENPKFAEELYCGLLGQRLPAHTEVRSGSEAMTRGDEAVIRNCDNVVVYYSGEEAAFALLFEVQRSEDDRKHYSWLDYIASARSRLQCPVALVVISFDQATAAWARQPILTGHPGLVLIPLVIGPELIPLITDPNEGRESIPVMLLSLLAHAAGEHGKAVMTTYKESIRHLDPELWSRYADYAINALRGELNNIMQELIVNDPTLPDTYRQGPLGAKYQEGKSEGEAEGEAKAILRILANRGVSLGDASRERIESCRDIEQLERWIDAALTVERADDLFE